MDELWASTGKRNLVLRLTVGRGFRNKALWETVSRNKGSEWDTVSARGPLRKARPRIGVQNGMRFPLEGSGGNRIPL